MDEKGDTPSTIRYRPSTLRSRGPAATTSGLHPDNDGSSPSGISSILDFGFWILDCSRMCAALDAHIQSKIQNRKSKIPTVLAEQPGVLATLSRWRSGVQIPSGTLTHDAVRNPAKRRMRPTGVLPVGARPSCIVGSTPSRVTEKHASAEHWRAQVAVTHPP